MPTYTPYDGSATPFTIGLAPLDPADWIEPDGDLAAYLAEKRRLLESHREMIFKAEAGTEEAQAEVLALLCAYLPDRHPHLYRRIGGRIEIEAAPTVNLADAARPALETAGLLVQDDLVLMRRGDAGWRIAAAFVAFPSSWSLEEKFGRVMDEVHAEVPDFQGGSRNAELINRMFDRLPADRAVKRLNWSLNWTDELFLPKAKSQRVMPDLPPDEAVLRVERQTLRKLPASGDILFTIRIYLDPIAALAREADGASLMRALARQLGDLTEEQAAYKGLSRKRAELVARLTEEADRLQLSQALP